MMARTVSGPPASTAARMTYALAKKPAVGGMPGQGQQEQGHEDAQQRLLAPEAGERVERRGHAGPLLERGDDRERAEVHERVGRAVEEQALEALDLRRRRRPPGPTSM